MPREKPAGKNEDLGHLVRVGGLVVGALITLTMGAALQVDSAEEDPTTWTEVAAAQATPVPTPPEPRDDAAPPTPQDPNPIETGSPRPLPPPAPEIRPAVPAAAPSAANDSLARRIDDGLSLRGDDRWTLQFMYTCDPGKAARLLGDLDGDPQLHLLQADPAKPECLRVCWGRFADREAAVSARGIPGALRALSDSPMPRPIADLLP